MWKMREYMTIRFLSSSASHSKQQDDGHYEVFSAEGYVPSAPYYISAVTSKSSLFRILPHRRIRSANAESIRFDDRWTELRSSQIKFYLY